MNDERRLTGEFGQQREVVFVEGAWLVGVHINNPAEHAIDFQRDGEFRPGMFVNRNVAFVGADIGYDGGLALLSHPAGDAFTDTEFQFRARSKTVRSLNLEKPVDWVDQDHRAGGGVDEADRLADDQVQCLLLVQRGVDHLAYLIKPPELPWTDGGMDGSFVAHRLAHDGTGAEISQGCVVATALGRA